MGVAHGGEQTISFLESSASLLSLGAVESLMKGVRSWEDNCRNDLSWKSVWKQYPVLWDAPLRSRIYGALSVPPWPDVYVLSRSSLSV